MMENVANVMKGQVLVLIYHVEYIESLIPIKNHGGRLNWNKGSNPGLHQEEHGQHGSCSRSSIQP